MLKEFWENHKKKIIVVLCGAVLYAAATFGLGIEADISSIFNGELSGLANTVDGTQ